MTKIKQIITFVIQSIKGFFVRLYNRLESFVERMVKKFENQAEKYLLEMVGGDCHTAIGVTADARPEKGLLQMRCSYHDGVKAKHIQEIGPIPSNRS